MERIVFSDIDGTLLDSKLRISPKTLGAIRTLQTREIQFVPISARNPPGIYPILEEYELCCPIVAYSGALILDAEREVIWQRGLSKPRAAQILEFLEDAQFDLTWGVYALDEWVVRDRKEPRIIREETIVRASSREGSLETLHSDTVSKILCICLEEETEQVEQAVRRQFPECTVVRSSDILLEIMASDINKAQAVRNLCELWSVPLTQTLAFGDHYNDLEMLKTAGKGFLMANAPAELQELFSSHTEDNDHDGIAQALKREGWI